MNVTAAISSSYTCLRPVADEGWWVVGARTQDPDPAPAGPGPVLAAGDQVGQRIPTRVSRAPSASDSDSTSPKVHDTTEGWRSWARSHTGYDGASPAELRRR